MGIVIVPYFPLAVSLVVGVVVVVAMVALRRRTSGEDPALKMDAAFRSDADEALNLLWAKVVIALWFGLISGIVAVVWIGLQIASVRGSAHPFRFWAHGPSLYFGPLQGLSPVLAALVVIVVVIASPGVAWPRRAERSAGLAVRRSDSLSSLALVGFTGSLAALTAFLASTGATPIQGQYPGWSYGIPLIGGAALVGAALSVAHIRIARSQGAGVQSLQEVDAAIRRSLSRFIALIATAGVVVAIGIDVWSAGDTTLRAARFSIPGNCHDLDANSFTCSTIGYNYAQPTFAFGVVEALVGAVIVAAGLVVVVIAARQSRLTLQVEPAREAVDA